MRYAKIREMDISNGEGIGISLFVQGCHFHCKGCFNPETWNFNGGKEWTKEIEDKFIELAGKPHIKRISILGGEPLADENVDTVFSIVQRLRNAYPDKKIWMYTGYLWEDICNVLDTNEIEEINEWSAQLLRYMTASMVDIVVDGQFQIDKQDLYNEKIVWAGSTNQRIINIKRELNNKQ